LKLFQKWEGEIKENDEGTNYIMIYILYIVRTFVNATMNPFQHNNK
jgi:hypothetical protein